jgi:hypothetical protein
MVYSRLSIFPLTEFYCVWYWNSELSFDQHLPNPSTYLLTPSLCNYHFTFSPTLLHIIYKWEHMLFVWLISLNIISSRVIHIVPNSRISFLNSIPSCMCTTFALSIHLLVCTLGRLHILAIMNNTTMNTGIQVSSTYSFH